MLIMKTNSKTKNSETRLVFCNLPAPTVKFPEETIEHEMLPADYKSYIDTLTDGIDRIVLVKGTGKEVVTAYF